MVQKYALMECPQQMGEGSEESLRPTYRLLNIITDDTGQVVEVSFQRYRASHATAIAIFNLWRDSQGQTLEDFYRLIEEYGDACLQVVPLGVG